MTKKRTPKDPEIAAAELLETAEDILRDVDDAYIFKTFPARELPSFQRSELSYGPVLGVGGFCVVKEIRAVKLQAQAQASGTSSKEDEENAIRQAARGDSGLTTDDDHYDVSDARGIIARRCIRDGDARYAVKFLQRDLSKLEHARGIIDLAIEAKYLSVVSHPNIIKMRGWAAADSLKGGFFLVLDRLYSTLEQKMDEWRKLKKEAKGLFGIKPDKEELQELMIERLLVAYDLAAAFRYLHENNLVYRDIKPENIGFDVRGDVKVFDFGLCKDLNPKLECKDEPGMYKLTGRSGSFPYMAVEVAQCRPYNCSADVFSFGIMLWEILALKIAFGKNLTRKEFYNRICLDGERPPVNKKWPPLTRQTMQEAWSAKPAARPTFNRLAQMIRADLQDLTEEDEVMHRTQHMIRRSRCSISRELKTAQHKAVSSPPERAKKNAKAGLTA